MIASLFRRHRLSYVPSWSAVVALSSIVKAFTMTTHKQDFVHSVQVGVGVQRIHDLSESLPLGSIACPGARIRLVDKAEVDCGLRFRIRSVPVLFEKVTYVVKS
jgi:hypothetical protein